MPKENGVLFGVCASLANRYDLDVIMLRICFLFLLFVSFGLVLIFYILMALFVTN